MALQSDLKLALHPWHALFFGVFALYVYRFLVFGIASIVFPELSARVEAQDPASVNILWGVQCLTFIAIFVHMTFWAELVGAGPFSAPIRTTWKWAIGAVIGGPVIYSAILAFSYYVIAGGSENWAYVDPEFSGFVDSAAVTGIMFAAVVIAGPIFEEVAYRGIAMGAMLGNKIPAAFAVTIPALVFAMSHTQYKLPALIAVFIFGTLLGILRLKSQSIAPPILAHMSVNLFLTVEIS